MYSGKDLKLTLKLLNITHQEVSEKIGISRSTITNWCRFERLDTEIVDLIREKMGIEIQKFDKNEIDNIGNNYNQGATMEVDINNILDKIKKKYGIKTDTELAKRLGLSSPAIISAWRDRNTLKIDLLLDAFPELDLNWLIKGEAIDTTDLQMQVNMLKKEKSDLENKVNEIEANIEKIEFLKGQISILEKLVMERMK